MEKLQYSPHLQVKQQVKHNVKQISSQRKKILCGCKFEIKIVLIHNDFTEKWYLHWTMF